MQSLYLVKVPLSIFQWLQMALFAVFLGLLKFLSNVRTLTLKSHYFKNISCENASVWARPLKIVLGLLSELKVSLDVIHSFFFCWWNYAWKTFLPRKFTQVGCLYNLIIRMKEEREGSPSVKTQLHFYCEKVHLSWFTNIVVLTCMKGKSYGMTT